MVGHRIGLKYKKSLSSLAGSKLRKRSYEKLMKFRAGTSWMVKSHFEKCVETKRKHNAQIVNQMSDWPAVGFFSPTTEFDKSEHDVNLEIRDSYIWEE